MEARQAGPPEAGASVEFNGAGPAELVELRKTCARQADVLDKLYTAVSALHRGAAALKAENAELRAIAQADDPPDAPGLELRVALDDLAPAAARRAVAGHVGHRVPPAALADAELVASELVSNCVQHSGVSAGASATLRVELTWATVLLEVADAGHDGFVAPVDAGGFGLSVVQTLSRRWGVERVAETGTRVWAELSYEPLATAPV